MLRCMAASPVEQLTPAAWIQVIKQVLKLKCSATFAVPVSEDKVPNYFKVIKEPRDLGSISEKLSSSEDSYASLGRAL